MYDDPDLFCWLLVAWVAVFAVGYMFFMIFTGG